MMLISRHNQLYSDNNEMHTINMSHNNLTQIESGWFESFHTKWSIGEREFAGEYIPGPGIPEIFSERKTNAVLGQVTMSGNPWICDCTTISFVEFQNENEWFKYQYDSRSGFVDLGTCQYPRALRNDMKMLYLYHRFRSRRSK